MHAMEAAVAVLHGALQCTDCKCLNGVPEAFDPSLEAFDPSENTPIPHPTLASQPSVQVPASPSSAVSAHPTLSAPRINTVKHFVAAM
jgi:hypothetical protein